MAKKLFRAFCALVFLSGVASVSYGSYACRDFFSTCTEGGCAIFSHTGNCLMVCKSLVTNEWINLACGTPPSPTDPDGGESSEPTKQ